MFVEALVSAMLLAPGGAFAPAPVMREDPAPNAFDAAIQAISLSRNTSDLDGLLKGDVDPNTTAQDGSTLLMWAAGSGMVEAVRALVRAGAKVDAIDTDGLTPLMHGAMALSNDVVRLLLEAGADPDRRNAAGQTAHDIARDRARLRQIDLPFSDTFLVLRLPSWTARHPVLDALANASRAAESTEAKRR